MDFPADIQVMNIGDQYMFGPSFMVCPVYRYQERSREVYFPAGCGWYDLYTGAFIAGGQRTDVDAPYDRMPLFVPEGSIIPVGPAIEYTGHKKDEPVEIYVYTGRDARFDLYEDEGTNYNYEKGMYSLISFTWSEADQQLVIHKREGEFEGMITKRIYHVIWVSQDNPIPFLSEEGNSITIEYDGEEMEVPFSD